MAGRFPLSLGHGKWPAPVAEDLRKKMGDTLAFQSPVGTLLEHEIQGHFMLCYLERRCRPPAHAGDLGEWFATGENRSIIEENKYRAYRHLPLVDWAYLPNGQRVRNRVQRSP
jgi:hypothetical protein